MRIALEFTINQCYNKTIVTRKAYKFALKTNPALERLFAQCAGNCRFVWNRALALQKERLVAGEPILRYAQAATWLVEWKRDEETDWLRLSPSHTLQQALRDLDRALMDAFDKKSAKRFPRFKKRGGNDSFRYPDPKQIELDQANSRIKLPKLGWVRYRKSREVEGTVKNVTVSRRGTRWYIALQVEVAAQQRVHRRIDQPVGIDLGVASFAVLSTGERVDSLNSYRKLEARLAREQRKLSRKVKFSSNWKKQKARVTRIHERIANARRDYLHKSSTAIAKNHGVVVLEDLRMSSMSASAKGTAAAPGRNVRAKSGLNKAILDQGWFEFRRQMEYKLAWAGGELVLVDPKNTSRRCHRCGHTAAENRTTQAAFRCVSCGHEAHADVNAARNILAAGQAVSACGAGEVWTPVMKQEPAGEVHHA